MIKHLSTMDNWAGDNKVSVWLGSFDEEDLLIACRQAREQFASRVEIGPINYSSSTSYKFYVVYVFVDKKDAMLFKLSV